MGISEASLWDKIVAVTAIVALIQPWVISLYKRLFLRGSLAIEESGLLEIGHTDIGPVIGLRGSLLADGREQFIRIMKITTTCIDNKAEENFEWMVFKQNKVLYDPASGQQKEEVTGDVAYPFVVSQTEAKQFNISFASPQRRTTLLELFATLRNEWDQKFLAHYNSTKGPVTLSTPQAQIMEVSAKFFEAFSKTDAVTDIYTRLDRDFFWKAAKYIIKLEVKTTRDSSFKKEWQFSLSDQHEKLLRQNLLILIRKTCKQSTSPVNFVWPKFKSRES